ncbi:DUF3857 domain-containing protein [Kordia jejudonensis]|uniref:DUF3857 domain-containing protein n=1 Tax=Kordia jejudonensis TaxID=1348245 RepID=UPI0006291D29|nr:DUF3857 domain-containing protein [Kordia jejudonensis]
MRIKLVYAIFLFLNINVVFAQEHLTTYLTLPQELTKNANAVVRLHERDIDVKAVDDLEITERRIVTVLNENGLNKIRAVIWYDDNIKVKDAEVKIYDKFGKQIKRIKEKDFKDVSAVEGGTLYSDSRVKYIDYTPVSYPFTAVFTNTTQTPNTAHLPIFSPVEYYLGVEKYTYTLRYPSSLTLYKKELNLEEFGVVTSDAPGRLNYTIENVNAIKSESLSPSEAAIKPRAYVTLNKFSYEGIHAEINDWNDFGVWVYQNLIDGRSKVDAATKVKIESLVADASSDKEKAKLIYEFMQNKTRYISVQVGIGGYQPIPAAEVDRVSYGDCKGLSNYMMALLKVAGVESYYTVVQAGDEIVDLYSDFASLGQGNHVILNIPNGGDDIWLECTSQKMPFGFIGDFTDDRNVLVVTPEGGKIKHTKKYATEENFQETTGSYTLNNNGAIAVDVTITTKGIQYSNRFYIKDKSDTDKDKYYKNYWRNINNISIDEIVHENDKENIVFTEKVKFKADAYAVQTGDRILFAPNALNKYSSIPDRYRKRKFPLKISRGFYDEDTYEIKLPSDYKIEAIPSAITLEGEFGSYAFSITQKDDETLIYQRSIKINDGEYPKDAYKNYRKFIKKIVKFDNAKIVLVKK